MTKLPSVNSIRDGLANISGALVNEPLTSPVDVGDAPAIPIHQPETDRHPDALIFSETPYDVPGVENEEDEPPVIYEIVAELDERAIARALSESGRDYEALVQVKGIEALGWYIPFHYRIAQHGIYLPSGGVLWLAMHCFTHKYAEDPIQDLRKKLEYATHAILRHESFHFAAECMAANWELLTGALCYVRAMSELKTSLGYNEFEEALANAYLLRGFRWQNSVSRGANATQALKDFIRTQPSGYRDGIKYVTAGEYEQGCRDLANEYQQCIERQWYAPPHTFEMLGLYPNVNKIDWRRCPILLVDEAGLFNKLGIVPRFIAAIPQIRETNLFKKQLMGLGSRYETLWDQARKKLSNTTALKGLDFKTWPPRGSGWYSVRLDRDVRAHLRNSRASNEWFAEEVGRHDVMQH